MFSIFNKLNYDTILYILDFLHDLNKINIITMKLYLSFIKNLKKIYYRTNDTNIPDSVTNLTFE